MTIKYLIGLLLIIGACSPIPKIVDNDTKGNTTTGSPSSSSALMIIPKKKAQDLVTIDWLSPTSAEINVKSVGGKVEVKVRITSPQPITLDQIDILVNGKPSGNKAGEVSILKRPEFKDEVLTAQVPVQDGVNQVQLVVTMAGDKHYFAETTLVKSATGIKVQNSAVSGNSSTRVTWTTPNIFELKGNEMYNTKAQELEVKFNITTPDVITLKDVKVLVNKIYKVPSPTAELKGSNGNYYFRDVVTLSDNLLFNEIGLKIESRSGKAESDPLKVNYSPSRPNLYVLSIGTKTNLKYTTKDARDFANLFYSQGKEAFRLFTNVTIDTLIGKAANTKEIQRALESLNTKIRAGAIAEDDIVLVFISSHGFVHNGDLRIQGDDYDAIAPKSTSVSYKSDILASMEALPCKKLLMLDACHSGDAKAARPEDINKAAMDLKNTKKGLAIFASSQGSEESHEDVTWQNGAFTEVLIKALKDGLADNNKNGIVTLNELEKYIVAEVPPMVLKVKNKNQHPLLTRNELGDIPLFITKK